MKSKQFRDVVLVEIDEEKMLVISCDSCGGVGEKESDMLKVPAYFTGRYTLRVCLLEVLCTGADVTVVANAVCNEMEPTGAEIIRGIKDELRAANLLDITLTGSTEENMRTVSTAVGMSVIGLVKANDLLIKKPNQGDLAVVIGLPKVGNEVILGGDPEILQYSDLYKLRKREEVKQIIPVGSKGIFYEADIAGNFILNEATTIDVYKSGGPSTCALLIVDAKFFDSCQKLITSPYYIIGEYR